jgi:triphosphoribosyl-dephospho-CoA synthase
MVASKMSHLSNQLSEVDNPEHLLPLLFNFDQELKNKGINPGTMADMTVVTVFTVFLEEVINLISCNKNLPI